MWVKGGGEWVARKFSLIIAVLGSLLKSKAFIANAWDFNPNRKWQCTNLTLT